MTDTTTLSKTVFFKASRETVWTYLTDKDKLGAWYHPAKQDLKQGEPYELFRKTDAAREPVIRGRVLELDRPNRLVTTFVIGPFEGTETTVTWILEEAAEGTRLSLTHEGIAEAAGPAAMQLLMALDKGWDDHLNDLRTAVAA